MALLLSSLSRCLHDCQTSIVTLITCCQAGVVPLMVMTLLPSMRRRLCHCCHCNCCPHGNGSVAVVDLQASLPSLSWHHCPGNKGTVALCNGVVAVLKLASSPLLQWHCCHHRCRPPRHLLSSWHCCRQCAGIFAIAMMAIVALFTMALLLLSMCRCLCLCQASVIALIACCQAGVIASLQR
jgi:hypothetical protein